MSQLYTFSCTLYGNDLIRYFNDEKVVAFLPCDMVGHSFTESYPKSAPVYNITAVLTEIASTYESIQRTVLCIYDNSSTTL